MSETPRSSGNATKDPPGLLRSPLRLSLFSKILIANSSIVIAGAIVGTALTAEFVRGQPARSTLELVGAFALVGVVISVAVNALILRLALSPLGLLQRTANAVRAGDFDARARMSPLADQELERLTRTFNAMLDGLDAYRERLREVAARALRAEEEERKRIARELHDETAQSLAALLVRLRVVRRVEDSAQRAAMLDALREQLAATLDGVRRYARGLRPPELDELGLAPAVEAFARTLAEGTGLRVEIMVERVEGRLTRETELALYRVVQEALSNVVRHAKANEARVSLRRANGTVIAEVVDDGRGFSVEEVVGGEDRGLGLFGMRERAAYVGGRVDIESEPGAGTRVRIVIPVNEA